MRNKWYYMNIFWLCWAQEFESNKAMDSYHTALMLGCYIQNGHRIQAAKNKRTQMKMMTSPLLLCYACSLAPRILTKERHVETIIQDKSHFRLIELLDWWMGIVLKQRKSWFWKSTWWVLPGHFNPFPLQTNSPGALRKLSLTVLNARVYGLVLFRERWQLALWLVLYVISWHSPELSCWSMFSVLKLANMRCCWLLFGIKANILNAGSSQREGVFKHTSSFSQFHFLLSEPEY